MSKFKKSFYLNFALLIVFKTLLEYIYKNIQSDLFGYVGYDYVFNDNRYVIGWALFLFTSYLVCSLEKGLYAIFMFSIHLLSITPFIVLYQFCPKCELWMLLMQIACMLFMTLIFRNSQKEQNFIPFKRIYNFHTPKFKNLLFFAILVFFAINFMYGGIPSLSSLLFENVYDTRAEANFPLPLILLQNFFCKIILPLCILFAIKDKKWSFCIYCLIVQVYIYGITGLKTYLFIPFVLMGIQRFSRIDIERVLIIGLTGLVGAIFILYQFIDATLLYAVFANRLLFFPAMIKYAYFDYFNNNEYAYFTQNSFSKVFGIESNYSTNIPNLIGETYFDKPGMWTNTGFMADAYSNLGFVGILLMASVLCYFIIIAQKSIVNIQNKNLKLVEIIYLIFFITLNDGAVISVLFSGGMIFAVLFFRYVKF